MPQAGVGIALGVVALGVLVVGLFPQPFIEAARGAAAGMLRLVGS